MLQEECRLIWQLILLGLAMGANNALASIGLGTSQLPRRTQFRTAIIFAIFEALMPVIGMAVGESLAGAVGNKARLIGIAVLVVMGVYSLFKRDGDVDESDKVAKAHGARIVFLAIALSLDNLTVGFGAGMFHAPLGLAALVFGLVSLGMTILGLELGRAMGKSLTISADKLTGVVLLIVAGVMAFV
ncbi:manganese efflux pump MntP family protein [Alicyclobacillus fodiniaquatilis]|uniref:Manganese efflux pump MntP family protein n=1 Tax=Alicyclobacillus fodiniaquatilis TaxID=1661150 RepID=A0ABW4JCY5_9BACL